MAWMMELTYFCTFILWIVSSMDMGNGSLDLDHEDGNCPNYLKFCQILNLISIRDT
jgi:hypothetical protein